MSGIEYYQEEYPDHEVVFLAVSDDMDWVRRNLGMINNVVMAGSLLHSNLHDDDDDDDDDDLDPAVSDMTLLSSCNHSIISQAGIRSQYYIKQLINDDAGSVWVVVSILGGRRCVD